MIKVKPRLAILGKSSNIVSNTLRYLCFILNNLVAKERERTRRHAICNISTWSYGNTRNCNGRTPEQLKWSEHYNKVERLHIEGKSNQAQEGKHRHWEVKPKQTSTVTISARVQQMFTSLTAVYPRFLNPNVWTQDSQLLQTVALHSLTVTQMWRECEIAELQDCIKAAGGTGIHHLDLLYHQIHSAVNYLKSH